MTFSQRHPALLLCCLAAALAGTALFRHPAYLTVSFCAAFAWSVELKGVKAFRFNVCMIPLILLFTLWYASFRHFGVTNLWRTPVGNYITLESLACGLALGSTIAALLMWMSCVHAVLTADKIVFLLGRLSPKLSLVCAILLRLVPRICRQALMLDTARKGLGLGSGQGNLLRRARNALIRCSGLVSWTLERIMEASASMKAQGGALRGRTAYALYRFDLRDRSCAVALAFLITLSAMGRLLGQTGMRFDPVLRPAPFTPLSLVFWAGWGFLCLLPLGTDLTGRIRFARARRALNQS